jgi:hypothetical protein
MKYLKLLFLLVVSITFISCSCGSDGGGGGGGDGNGNGNGEPVLNPPSTTTLDADTASKDSANLTGSVNPKGLATEYWFEWGTDPQLQGHVDVPEGHLDAGTADNTVSAKITGLNEGTKYYYRVCARNSAGESYGEVNAHYQYSNVIFVTSKFGTGNLGSWEDAGGKTGMAAGDAICQTLADNAGLKGNFKAWLSVLTTSARDRLVRSTAPYVRVDGERVANNWSELADVSLQAPINVNEAGEVIQDKKYTWTCTRNWGESCTAYWTSSCLDWTSNDSNLQTYVGFCDATDYKWSEIGAPTCNGQYRLYCIQQDLDLPQEPFNTGCAGPLGWEWHVSACSKGLLQDQDCAYVCCNFFNPTNNCYDIPKTFNGYTVNTCDYNTGLYSMGVSYAGENFSVTCEVQ